jgi:MtN3 and saliva related transmembrane protein
MNFYHIIELLFGLGLFLNALFFIPQIILVFKKRSAEDLSLVTFAGFNFLQLMTMLHGIINHDMILTVGMALTLVTCGFVTILIILDRLKVFRANKV